MSLLILKLKVESHKIERLLHNFHFLAVCAHTDDAQSDLNQFLLTFSRDHGRRITITDTSEYSLSAAIEPTMTGNGRVSRSLRRWSCLCCTCK